MYKYGFVEYLKIRVCVSLRCKPVRGRVEYFPRISIFMNMKKREIHFQWYALYRNVISGH